MAYPARCRGETVFGSVGMLRIIGFIVLAIVVIVLLMVFGLLKAIF